MVDMDAVSVLNSGLAFFGVDWPASSSLGAGSRLRVPCDFFSDSSRLAKFCLYLYGDFFRYYAAGLFFVLVASTTSGRVCKEMPSVPLRITHGEVSADGLSSWV